MESRLKSYYLAKRIPIQKLKDDLPFLKESITKETALYRIDKSLIYVYSFGAVTFVDVSDANEKMFIAELSRLISVRKNYLFEEYEIVSDASVKQFCVSSDRVVVKRITRDLIGVASRLLAQSVALEGHERDFEDVSERFLRLNRYISVHGRLKVSSKNLLRMIARNNLIMEEIISGIGILDKPDITWDNAFLDSLYLKLSDEFEFEERFEILNSKMNFVQENYRVFMESLRSRYEARLEWMIIILIAFEISVYLFEILFL